jgi:hypothetical protein
MTKTRPLQWYHSHADLIWPAGHFKGALLELDLFDAMNAHEFMFKTSEFLV